ATAPNSVTNGSESASTGSSSQRSAMAAASAKSAEIQAAAGRRGHIDLRPMLTWGATLLRPLLVAAHFHLGARECALLSRRRRRETSAPPIPSPWLLSSEPRS